MAWSWSHTDEAYANARRNLDRVTDETLICIAAEWRAWDGDAFHAGFHSGRFRKAQKQLRKLVRRRPFYREILAEEVFGRMSELATCTNGGWEAYGCPFGCGCHLISFDDEEA